MFLFPRLYNVILLGVSPSVPGIAIFFKDKLIASSKPLRNYALEDFAVIYLQTHLAICVCRNPIKSQFGFKIVPNCRPSIISFPHVVRVAILRFVINAIGAISLAILPNNSNLSLRANRKMDFVGLPNISLIFGTGSQLKGDFRSVNPAFRI